MTMKGTICGRSCESQYMFLENRQSLRINIEKRNVLFLVVYASLAVGINSKRYLGNCFLLFWKKDKVSCTTIVAEGIQSLVLDKVFLWNYLLLLLFLQVLLYWIDSSFSWKELLTLNHIKCLRNRDAAL